MNNIILNCLNTENAENIRRINVTLSQLCTLFNYFIFLDSDFEIIRYHIRFRFICFMIGDDNISGSLDFFNMNNAVNFRKYSSIFRSSCLKQFLDTRQTLCNIFRRRNTACMESSHCKLRTRFTD